MFFSFFAFSSVIFASEYTFGGYPVSSTVADELNDDDICYDYYVIFKYGDFIYMKITDFKGYYKIKASQVWFENTDTYSDGVNYVWCVLEDGIWEYKDSGRTHILNVAGDVFISNHDIPYDDGSGVFFSQTVGTTSTLPSVNIAKDLTELTQMIVSTIKVIVTVGMIVLSSIVSVILLKRLLICLKRL